MKKLLSLLLVLVLSLSLVACGGDGEGKGKAEDKAKTMETEATEVVEGYLDALMEFDDEEAAKYLDDEDAVPDEFKEFSIDKAFEDAPAEFAPYADDFEPVFNKVIDKAKDAMSYEIKEVEVDEEEEEVTFTVELTILSGDMDFEELIADKYDEEYFNQLGEELVNSGKITETMSEEELMDVLVDETVKILEEVVDDVEIETTTEEREFVVVKDGDDWKIDTEKSDLD